MNFDSKTREGRVNIMGAAWSYGLINVVGLLFVSIAVIPSCAAWLWLPWIVVATLAYFLILLSYEFINVAPREAQKAEPITQRGYVSETGY